MPPLADRLPEEPPVIEPVERIGRFCGTWRAGLRGGSDAMGPIRMPGYEPLVAWDCEWRNVVPHLATAQVVSDEARMYTLRCRCDMPWSNGRPLTAEDIAFIVNDMFAHRHRLGARIAGPAPTFRPTHSSSPAGCARAR